MVLGATLLGLSACGTDNAAPPQPGTASDAPKTFNVSVQNTTIGAVEVTETAAGFEVFYEFRNNGRGPTINETITLDEAGIPIAWTAEGATTFGNEVSETFVLENGEATWTDSTGTGSATVSEPSIYVAQNSSPYALAITARALLKDEDRSMPALPGGVLRLDEMETLSVTNAEGANAAKEKKLKKAKEKKIEKSKAKRDKPTSAG